MWDDHLAKPCKLSSQLTVGIDIYFARIDNNIVLQIGKEFIPLGRTNFEGF